MKEASNQKMVLENVVQNFMMNMILKKNKGGRNPPPPGLEDLKKSPGFKGLRIINVEWRSVIGRSWTTPR